MNITAIFLMQLLFLVSHSLAACPVPSIIPQTDRSKYPDNVQKEAIRGAEEIRKLIAQRPTQCPIATTYNSGILTRLLAGSNLNAAAYPNISIISTMGCFTPGYNMGMKYDHIQMTQEWMRRARSEEEYSFPMAHELAHFVLGHEEEALDWIHNHSFEMYSPAWYRMRLRQEGDADQFGMQILANANYNANVAASSLRRIFKLDGSGMSGGSAEHGSNHDRVNRLEQQSIDCGYPTRSSVRLDSKALQELKRLNP